MSLIRLERIEQLIKTNIALHDVVIELKDIVHDPSRRIKYPRSKWAAALKDTKQGANSSRATTIVNKSSDTESILSPDDDGIGLRYEVSHKENLFSPMEAERLESWRNAKASYLLKVENSRSSENMEVVHCTVCNPKLLPLLMSI